MNKLISFLAFGEMNSTRRRRLADISYCPMTTDELFVPFPCTDMAALLGAKNSIAEEGNMEESVLFIKFDGPQNNVVQRCTQKGGTITIQVSKAFLKHEL
jgi:hypothetical protein